MDKSKQTINSNDPITILIDHIKQNSPTGFVTRKGLEQLTGGMLKKQFLANIDSDPTKNGIAGRMKAGKQIFYPIEEVEKFLRNDYLRFI